MLEGANIKLASVISNVLGVSGRAMLEAMAAGVTAPTALAALGRPGLRATADELAAALDGEVGTHQRLLLVTQLRHITFLDQQVQQLERELDQRLAIWQAQVAHLVTIPGISRRIAIEVLAVLGPDLAQFPTAAQLASWAKLCPGLNESGGKRRSGATGHGNALLRTALTEAAWAASHTKETYLAAQFHRLAARRGKKRALLAVAHSLLVIVWHLLTKGEDYRELGADYFEQRGKEAIVRRAVRRLEHLGYRVTVEPDQPAA